MSNLTLSPLIAPSSSASGFLVVESGGLAGQRFPLPESPGGLLLGRERLCNIRFDPERDRVVGRTHARLEVRPDGIYLIDLNSANGTFRSDGTAVRGEVRLNSGDRFQLGGEGGPWLMLQGAVAKVALHVAAPLADAPTMITRLRELPVSAVSHEPRPAPASLAPLSPSLPHAADGLPPGAARIVPAVRVSEPAPTPAVEQPRRAEPFALDPLEQQQHNKYRRQVAVIALLLVLACSLGLAIGLRDGTDEDEADTTHVRVDEH